MARADGNAEDELLATATGLAAMLHIKDQDHDLVGLAKSWPFCSPTCRGSGPPRPACPTRSGTRRAIGIAAPVLVGVLVSLVVIAYSQHRLGRRPAFAAPGPNSHPLVPILVVLLVIGCLAPPLLRPGPLGMARPAL